MSLFTAIVTAVRTRQVSLTLFGREFLIRLDPTLQSDPVDHVLWNIAGFNLFGSVDRYSAQVEGFVAVLGFTVNLDLAFSTGGTGGANLTIETPLFTLDLTVGAYPPEPVEQSVRGLEQLEELTPEDAIRHPDVQARLDEIIRELKTGDGEHWAVGEAVKRLRRLV